VVGYNFANYEVENIAPLPSVVSGGLTREVTGLAPATDKLTVATFNVENLAPSDGATKFSNLADRIVNNLKSPDIISVEEVQDNPGPIDPTNSAFTTSRKPLAGELTFNGRTVFVIGNHFNSKGGDDPLFGPDQPPVLTSETQRNNQATVVKGFVQSILGIDA